MPQEATVRNLPQAYRVIKQMRLNGWEVAGEYREAARGRRGKGDRFIFLGGK